MVTQDQSEVIAFLESPATHGGVLVERIDSHASIVFLTGPRAWKLKRAVLYDYLDFSDADRRKAMCEAEVHLNRRTAPTLYRGVVAVTREADGALALGGPGAPVDWLVEMTRFDQDGLLDRIAARATLDMSLMRPLAEAIAEFHESAERRRDHGGKAGMEWVISGNVAGFAEQGADILDPVVCARLTEKSRRELARQGALLDSRRDTGFVRHCHGDLHLRNIVLIDGRPTLFDGIEFNDEIACIDVLYDLSFLLMDLWRRGLQLHANVVWNSYLARTLDYGGIGLLPLFLSCRAAVRAKTSATAANLQTDTPRRAQLRDLARVYLSLAEALLDQPGPSVVAVGGLSGSGKSTLARLLAPSIGPAPGAVVIRSDEIRKRLCGVSPSVHLGAAGYTEAISKRVYDTLSTQAGTVVQQGYSAILDAVFARSSDRRAVEGIAQIAGVPFVGLWLNAPEFVLLTRAQHRLADDPSDADAEVIRQQLGKDVGPIAWRRIDASVSAEHVLREAFAISAGAANDVQSRVSA